MAVINHLASETIATCQHIEYLISKSERPGSGVAIALSCDFSSLKWKSIAAKADFSIKTMKLFLLQGVILSFEDVQDIVDSVDDSKIELLNFTLREMKEPLSSENLSSLFSIALNKEKKFICSVLITEGAKPDLLEIMKLLKPLEIIDQKPIYNLIKSSKKSREMFLQVSIKRGNHEALECCKSLVQEMNMDDINLHSLLEALVQGNKDKQHSIQFIDWLLQQEYVDPNRINEGVHPLNTVHQLALGGNKNKLFYLLLKYGASFRNALLSESEKISIIQSVALSALTSGK